MPREGILRSRVSLNHVVANAGKGRSPENKDRAVGPCSRLCSARRPSGRGGAVRSRPDTPRRDGRPFCAQHFDGGSDRRFTAASNRTSARDTPDDRGSGFFHSAVRRGRLGFVSRSLGRQSQPASDGADHNTLGKRVGVAINPATPGAVLEEILSEIDQVLVMTVDPGFGHQQFLYTTLSKISIVRQMIDRLNPRCDLEVDGGIDPTTAQLAVEAGANVLVAGSAVFGAGQGVTEGMTSLRASIRLTEQ